MGIFEEIVDAFLPSLSYRKVRPMTYPEINWTRVVDAEIRLMELELKRQELGVRKLEALAKLKAARSQKEQGE